MFMDSSKWRKDWVDIRPSKKNINVYRPRPLLSWGRITFFKIIIKIEAKPHALLSLRLRLHGTGPEPFRTEPDRIGFCLHGTVWNWSRCLHGTFLEPVRIGSDTGPAKQQVQFWIRSGPVPERSRVNRRPIRSENRTGPGYIYIYIYIFFFS